MKNTIFISLIIILITVSCSSTVEVQTEEDQSFVLTQVAATIYAEMKATESPTPTPIIEPTATISSLGTRSNPIPLGQTIDLIYEDVANFQISIIEVKRGNEAWSIIQQANMFNDQPLEGMEYILAKVRVNYQASTQQDYILSVTSYSFKSVSNNQILDTPSVVKPEPALSLELFPGGNGEGYIVVLTYADDQAPLIVYEDWTIFDNTPFYFSLSS